MSFIYRHDCTVHVQCTLYFFFIIYFKIPDGKGKNAKLVIWSHPGDDVTGIVSRSRKVVDSCQKVTFIRLNIVWFEIKNVISFFGFDFA